MAIARLQENIQLTQGQMLPLDPVRRRHMVSILTKWIGLLCLALTVLYLDTKSITACILINNRQVNTTDVQTYLSSVAESFSSGRSGVFQLRGSFGENEFDVRTVPSPLGSYGDNELDLQNTTSQRGDLIIATEIHDQYYHKKNLTPVTSVSKQKMSSNISDPRTTATQRIAPNELDLENSAINGSDRLNLPGDQTNKNVKVLCLSGETYGRTMNQFIQLAVLLHQLVVNGASVVAFKNSEFSQFFKEWFDPRDDIWVDYDENAYCDEEYDAATLHYLYFDDVWKQVAYQFKTLIPKASIRAEAELAIKEYSGPFNIPITTVHRRDLEGACVLFAEEQNLLACPNTQSSLELDVLDYKNACLIDYPTIANETNGTQVVLLTDSQVPDLDKTFPIISNHSFPVQSWMMAKSNVHYGNPFSTVDVVVYYWRNALLDGSDNVVDMRPSACYRPTPIESDNGE